LGGGGVSTEKDRQDKKKKEREARQRREDNIFKADQDSNFFRLKYEM